MRKKLTSLGLAKAAARAADDKKALDIVVLGLGEENDLADYFVLATVESTSQMGAVESSVEEALREAGSRPLHRDGMTRSRARWMVLDYGSIMVHVFLPEARDLYRLDKLWEEAKTVRWEKSK